MPKAPTYTTGKGEYDGAIPIVINSPAMTLHTAVTNQNPFVAPCDLEIVQVTKNLIEAPGTAAGTVNIGTRADVDAFLVAHSIATTDPTGSEDIPVSALVTANINKGDVVEFDTGGEATTTGIAAFTVVCMPR